MKMRRERRRVDQTERRYHDYRELSLPHSLLSRLSMPVVDAVDIATFKSDFLDTPGDARHLISSPFPIEWYVHNLLV